MNVLGLVIAILMALSILLIPLGLPGLWIMAALVGVGVWAGQVSAWVFIVAVLLTGLAELAEWLIVRSMNLRYGGSPRAFWGAIIGGFVGVLLGAPVPVVGSVVAGLVGSFVGAAVVTYYEMRDIEAAGRVGWGVFLARTLAVGVKVAVAIAILVVGGAAWIFV